MKAIITGGTGMIGGIILRHCLASPQITKVVSLVRKPSGFSHEKLEEVVHKDFLSYQGKEEVFKDVSIVYFCIGVYTGAVPDDKFREITVDYAKVFADMLKMHSPDARFCFLSGGGADQTEKSRTSFARYKGMAENYLQSQKFGGLYLFRPGYIYPVERRKEPNAFYSISRSLYPVMKLLGKNFSIKSTELGEAMFLAGIHGAEKSILENRDIMDLLTSSS